MIHEKRTDEGMRRVMSPSQVTHREKLNAENTSEKLRLKVLRALNGTPPK